jgi:hypothetical protein
MFVGFHGFLEVAWKSPDPIMSGADGIYRNINDYLGFCTVLADFFYGVRDNVIQASICGYIDNPWLTVSVDYFANVHNVRPKEGFAST